MSDILQSFLHFGASSESTDCCSSGRRLESTGPLSSQANMEA